MIPLILVDVLLTTYNGEDFLEKQLESILFQQKVKVEVTVIDDGSTDRTLDILRDYQELGLITNIFHTPRLGHARASIEGVRKLNNCKFLCFADQDDVWAPDRLINVLKNKSDCEPQLIAGRRTYINSLDEVIGRSRKLRKNPHWKNAIIENVCYGNTIVLNGKGFALVKKFQWMDPIIFDAWLYLLFSLFGTINYLEDSKVLYRLHANNHVGIPKYWQFKRIVENQEKLLANAMLLLQYDESELDSEFISVVKILGNSDEFSPFVRWVRIALLPIFRQSFIQSFVLKSLAPFIYNHKH